MRKKCSKINVVCLPSEIYIETLKTNISEYDRGPVKRQLVK
jgi:hypothetical protein